MDPPPDTFGRLISTISSINGPATRLYLPIFMQNVDPQNVTIRSSHFFLLLYETLRDDADFFFELSDPRKASKCLSCALQTNEIFKKFTCSDCLTEKDVSTAHLKLATIAMMMDNFETALTHCNTCIELTPSFAKPYEFAAELKSKQRDFAGAALYLLRMFAHANVERLDFLGHIMVASTYLAEVTESADIQKFRPFSKSVLFSDPHREDWLHGLKILRDENRYAAMALLTTGNCGVTFEPPTYLHKLADVPGLKYEWLDIGSALRHLRGNPGGVKAWHLRLADFVVKRGADVLQISQAFSQPLLVIMTTLSVEGEVPSFLDLAWDRLTCLEYDTTDRQNNTPLHAFVKSSNWKTFRMAEVILKSLLAKGCLALEKDLRGKMPHDYLPPTHQFHKLLSSAAAAPEEGLINRLEKIREYSKKALATNDLRAALEGYKVAADIAEKFPRSLRDEKAILYSNMAAVHLKKDEPKEALEAVEKSLRNDAGYVKSYLRQGQALSKLNRHPEACRSFKRGFDATSNMQEQVKFCMEAIYQISHLRGERCRQILGEMKTMLVSVWQDVLGRLTRDGNWTEVNILLCGPPKFDDDLGIMADFMCTPADLKTIFDFLPKIKFDLGRLLITLLERSADFLSLAVSEKDTPFHALVRLCMREVVPWPVFGDIYDVLLSMPELKNKNPKLDAEGRNLLHTVCIESQTLLENEHVGSSFGLLLSLSEQFDWKLDPKLRDKHSKMPLDYCIPGSLTHKIFNLILDKSKAGSRGTPSPKSFFEGNSKTQSGGARSGTSTSSNHAGNSAPPNMKWEDLKQEGGKAYSSRNFQLALGFYTNAITKLRQDLLTAGWDLMRLPESHSHDLAVLYGNCAECHCQMKNYDEFFECARQNVNYDGLWFKGHYRVGRACLLRDEPKVAVQAFVNSYNHLKPAESKTSVQIELLRDLTEAVFQLKASKTRISDGEIQTLLTKLKPVSSDKRMNLALSCIKGKTLECWKKAEFVFGLRGSFEPVTTKEDLNIFCKKDLLCRQGWVCTMILQLLNAKDNIPTLKFHPGDHYLHAALTLVVVSGSSPTKHPDAVTLLETVINFAKTHSKLNWQDPSGNTALHLLAQCKGPCEPMREKAAILLIENGIDVLVARNDGKRAVEVMNMSDKIRVIVQNATDQAIAIERFKAPPKASKAKPAQPSTQPDPPKQQNKAHSASNSRQETSKDIAGTRKRECDECERSLQNANRLTNKNLIPIYKDLVKIVKASHKQDDRHKMFRDASIKHISKFLQQKDVPDIPDCVIDLKAVDFKELVLIAAEAKQWTHLMALVFKFKEKKGQDALSRFAERLSLSEVIENTEITEATKDELVKLLATHGAEKGTALQKAAEAGFWKVAMTLLDLGANPEKLSLSEGDTPLHVAVKIALEEEPGNLEFLRKLKQLFDANSSAYPYLNLSCQDQQGHSLMHLATKCKFSSHALTVVERLCSWNCPVNLLDHAGQTPLDYLKRNDRRAEFLRSASSGATGAKRKTTVFSEKIDTDSSATKLRDRAQDMLTQLPEAVFNYLDEELEEEEDEEEDDEDEEEKALEDEEDAEDSDDQIYGVSEDEADQEDSKEEDVAQEDLEIDARVFDDLLWDVECTEAVWNLLKGSSIGSEKAGKAMRKERISDEMKKIVVNKIRQLASGNWRPHLQRKIHGVPESLVLHRVQLPGGACILWELAVAFSPHKSQRSGGVHAGGDNSQNDSGGGRIYSEIIRVWSIVLHHSEVQRKVKWIVGSHKRGKDCLVQKKLKGLASSQFAGVSHSTRNPILFMEHEIALPKKETCRNEHQQHSLCPPASAQRNEFQILKFYSFSSALVAAILSNSTRKIDFPFRVTDLEYEMIHLESVSPILLLGRSGTGKTTCCLYRLWAKFLCYWERAIEIGDAWLPQRNPALDIQENEDEDEEEEEEQEFHPASKTRETNSPHLEDKEDSHSSSEGVDCEIYSDEEEQESTDDDSEDTENKEEEETGQKRTSLPQEIFSHLHQLFVTKNPKLCSEVEKNFLKLRHASGALTEHNSTEKEPLPNTLQEVEDLTFPLFLTSRQLLLLLDASVEGDPFFARDEDLGLKYAIPGWGTREDIFTIDPLDPNDWLDSENEDDDDSNEKNAAAGKGASSKKSKEEFQNQSGEQKNRNTYLRRECTFEVFANEVWPKISRKAQMDCHPSLVWTEIMSFIQGSFEALGSNRGHLNQDDYLTLGRKRAPNFSGDRSKVYAAFQLYRKFKQDRHLFDESDLVYNIYRRLREMQYYQPWILHEIYVDETQDFTQAELTLLMCICQDPNKMFLAGDTAQAIMRGISFRFKDLSSLFHYAAQSIDPHRKGRCDIIKIPDKVHQLRYNYRSHSGILSLASSVLDILQKFFPESFDRLHRDQGMFPGPKPVVIETCSSEDLALLLSGNQRVSSHIEFGAHQAILVMSEESKARLPEVLTAGLVLTIYEAKGLEFDDVLLYNFFADSQAEKEWRVVTEYLDELALVSTSPEGNSLVEIDSDILDLPNRPRPLAFDPDQHKILNSELKQLYTAITRARVNVWIFDEEPQSRAPMFEYFKARRLVQCMGAKEEPLSENFMFAQKSSPQQWRKSGDKFMNQRQFALAAKCFKHAGHHDREKLALAYQSATEASALRSRPSEMRRQYLKAGAQFVWCGDLRRAGLCFQNAREHKLAGLAFEKHGEFEAASKQYQFVPSPSEASRCLEQAGMFRKAIAILEDSHFYDRAIDCLRRYQIKIERVKAERGIIPKVLVDNRPKDSQSEDDLCHRAANFHHGNKDFEKAKAAIIRLKNPSDQLVFLERNGYWEKAAEVHREKGETEKAAKLMLKAGKMERACSFAKEGFHKDLEASIYLAMARKNLPESNSEKMNLIDKACNFAKEGFYKSHEASIYLAMARKNLSESNSEQEKTSERYAETALSKYTELRHIEGQAEAKLFLGKLTGNLRLLKDAHELFKFKVKPRNLLAELECYHTRYQCSEQGKIVEKLNADLLARLLKIVQRMVTEELEGLPASFYGLEIHGDTNGQKTVTWYPVMFPRCAPILNQIKGKELQEPSQGFTVDIDKAIAVLAQHVLNQVEKWAQQTKDHLREKCTDFLERKSLDKNLMMNYLDDLVMEASLDESWQFGWESLQKLDVILKSRLSEDNKWQSATALMDFLIPDYLPAWRSNEDHMRKLVKKVLDCKPAAQQIIRFLRHEWDNPGRVGRGLSENRLKERCKSTDWVVRAGLFSCLLLTWDRLNVENEVKKLETELTRHAEYYKQWAEKGNKYALFGYKWIQEKDMPMIEHLGSRFTECLDHLICQQDCEEAFFAFTKMLIMLGKRAKPSLMPHIKHLVFWLEVFLSMAWFFIGRGMPKVKTLFYMSTSLFSSVEVVNACILGNDTHNWTIQKMATAKNVSRVGERLKQRENYLIHFLVGNAQFSNFGLLSLVSSLCKGDAKGEVNPLAERIVFLSLLALLNIPEEFVQSSNERLIRREFAKLQQDEELPEDLRILAHEVHEAKTYDGVAAATINYLSRRYKDGGDQPLLCRCQWVGRLDCPMTWTKLQADDYPPGIPFVSGAATELENIQETKMSAQEEDLEELEEEKKREAKLEKLQAEASRAMAAEMSSKEEAGEDTFNTEVDRLFHRYSQVSWTECDICNEEFSANPSMMTKSTAKDDEKGASAAFDDIDDMPSESGQGGTDTDLKSKHLNSPTHIEKMEQFEIFKKFYITEIHPQLEDIKAFTAYANSEGLGTSSLEASRMISAIVDAVKKFEELRLHLLSKRLWCDVKDLRQGFLPVNKEYQGYRMQIEKLIQERKDRDKEAQEHQDKMEDGLAEVDDLDPNDRPLPVKGRGRGRGRTSGHQNNSKRPGHRKNLPPRMQKMQNQNN